MVKFSEYVTAINCRYNELSSLSNDKLREELNSLKVLIKQATNKEKALSDHLVEVYAIIKETERRFSCGNIVVTANEKDKQIAKSTDFVEIVDDTAVYHNRWSVCNDMFVWNMIPYDEQILGGIYLHFGYAAEMTTGEGKTLVATFPVFLNALTGQGVHLMTSNDYLSQRDFEQTRPIYLFHGLTAACIERCINKDDKNKAYNKDITFGSTSTFIFDYLNDHLVLRPEDCKQLRPYNFAVIDELDSTLIDESQTLHIIGGGGFYNRGEDYKKYKPIIEEFIKDPTLFVCDKKKGNFNFTEKGKIWLKKKLYKQNLFTYNKLYEVPNIDKLPKEKIKQVKGLLYLQNVLFQLLRAYTIVEKDVDYIIENDSIVIIDENTGRKKPLSRWEHGLHTAVEVKENIKVKDDFDGLAVISVKNFFRLYKSVCGMSGTIMQVAKELKEIYNLESVVIPTHKPMIRKDHPLSIYRNKEDKDTAIVRLIQTAYDQKRPVLVGCPSEKRNDEICKLLELQKIPFRKLSARSLDKEAFIISTAGMNGAITVSTSIAGRGTDIKLSDKAKKAGGLFVIGTDLFNSKRVDRQLSGRAGRQGDPGESQFFSSCEDEILTFLPDEESSNLYNLLSAEKFEVSRDKLRIFFDKAQKEKESKNYQKRIHLSDKDDVVDTFRKSFYEERNSLLFNSNKAIDKLYSLLVNDSKKQIEIETHIKSIYKKIHAYIYHVLINEKIRNELRVVRIMISNTSKAICFQIYENYEDIELPFSDNRYLFLLKFNREKLNDSLEYFKHEYIRQNLLLLYDKYWSQFVKYILSDLDDKEVKELPDKYKKVYDKINKVFVKRLLNATIPFEKHEIEGNPVIKDIPKDINIDKPEMNDLCPCGSGKKYCECHGSNIRNTNIKKKRRR